MPCADRNEHNMNINKTSVSQTTSNTSGEEQDEACSPFCICACCGQQAAFNMFSTSIKHTRAVAEKRIPLRNQNILSNYYGNIWQPPKLS